MLTTSPAARPALNVPDSTGVASLVVVPEPKLPVTAATLSGSR